MSWILQSRESENSLSESNQEESCSLPPLVCAEMTNDSISYFFWFTLDYSRPPPPLFLDRQRMVVMLP